MGINLLKGMGKAYQTYKRNKASKKVFDEVSGFQHPVISKVDPAKNLAERRKTFDMMTEAVDKQYEKSGTKITAGGQKIKKEAVIKGSKIHDKYEKLQKILNKKK